MSGGDLLFRFIFNSMILSILLLPKPKHARVGALVRDTTIFQTAGTLPQSSHFMAKPGSASYAFK
jgi:hypothetical protein